MRHRLAVLTAIALTFTACTRVGPPPAGPEPASETVQPQPGPAGVYAPAQVTAADYQRAESMLSGALDSLVYGEVQRGHWREDGWYVYTTRKPFGQQVVAVEPESGRVQRNGAGTEQARANMAAPEGPGRDVVVSPDGRLGAFTRDYDLWVRDLETGEEYRITEDGEASYGYATNNAGWTRSDRPVLAWSPDSRRIFTFRHDARGVGMMYLTTTNVGHPELDAWHYPMPEDTVIFRIERLVADVGDPSHPEVTFLDMLPDPHRSSTCDHIYCGGQFLETQWMEDGESVAFLSTRRDHKAATLRIADAATGEVRDILSDSADTFFMSGLWGAGHNWRVLPESGEVIWWNRETNWGHLYLHDLATGERTGTITSATGTS